MPPVAGDSPSSISPRSATPRAGKSVVSELNEADEMTRARRKVKKRAGSAGQGRHRIVARDTLTLNSREPSESGVSSRPAPTRRIPIGRAKKLKN